MPIVHFHLPEGCITSEQEGQLLRQASQIYADVLQSPIERTRAFLHVYGPSRHAAGGKVGGAPAPFFEFIVLDGRPLDVRQQLMRAFTHLIADVTGVPVAAVRGHCRRVLPEEWCIGGEPATAVRPEHIQSLRSSGEGH